MIYLCFFLFSFSLLPPFLLLYASDDKLSVFADFLIGSKFHYLTCGLNQLHWVLSLIILLKFMPASTALKIVYRNCPLTYLLSYTNFLLYYWFTQEQAVTMPLKCALISQLHLLVISPLPLPISIAAPPRAKRFHSKSCWSCMMWSDSSLPKGGKLYNFLCFYNTDFFWKETINKRMSRILSTDDLICNTGNFTTNIKNKPSIRK